MQLQEWIKITGVKQACLARMLGISGQRMTRILKHGAMPYLDEMVKLYWVTNGNVRPDDFFLLPPLPAELQRYVRQPLTSRRNYERITRIIDRLAAQQLAQGARGRHRRKRPALDH